MAAFLRALLEAQGEVNPVDDADDDGLPGDQVSEPIKQLSVQDMCLLPAGIKWVNLRSKNHFTAQYGQVQWWRLYFKLITPENKSMCHLNSSKTLSYWEVTLVLKDQINQ